MSCARARNDCVDRFERNMCPVRLDHLTWGPSASAARALRASVASISTAVTLPAEPTSSAIIAV